MHECKLTIILSNAAIYSEIASISHDMHSVCYRHTIVWIESCVATKSIKYKCANILSHKITAIHLKSSVSVCVCVCV